MMTTATKKSRVSIASIRSVIDNLNWNRKDATGGTPDENRRTNLPMRLAPGIAAVAALQIPERFPKDIEKQRDALLAAARVLERWVDANNVWKNEQAALAAGEKLTRVHDIEVGRVDFEKKTVVLIDKSDLSVLPVLNFYTKDGFDYCILPAEMKRVTDIKSVSLTLREVDFLRSKIEDEIDWQS